MNFTFQRGFLAHHNAVLSLSAECVQVDKKILMHIHYIFTKNIVKHRTSDPGAGNCTILEEIMIFIMNYSIFLKGFTQMLWTLGVMKFTIYGLLLYLLHTKSGTNNLSNFRQEAENAQILTHDDEQNQIEIGHP